ncbi:odorant-binding protein 59a isoform X2 [Monomorium pharaonis]|uniref:odorant-binding protein 59a isoform X2 n=1 Tax=Monomorium pharaonis TaxID=307658 RepID=UPI00063F6B9D|nr:odorant-binding protein 59a isoform X2 [Monomorium pharaonis]
MTRLILVILCSLCLLLIESVNSLKCRTGVQQTDDQYRKIMQICKKRSTTDDDDDDDDDDGDDDDDNYSNSSTNKDDNDDSSNVDLFGTRFFISGGSKYSITQWKNANENRNRGNDQRNGNNRRYSVSYTNKNWGNAQYPSHGSNNFNYFDGTGRPSYDQIYNGNSGNYDKQQEQTCITQCFFNELNMVDQRGFPEQVSIIQFLTRNIHNPELQDFIEEAVIECFHYLDSDIRNKCYFSENLITCLIEKGKERCEDWNN